ncbi:MAG TPA: haloacid dehalogenase-like hydrolase [Erysipelotrichaceae bacterium]|nr:haloacid dehalogenase-like hydrolase [Erysipelotrichaceae bacterium]HQB32356.1 haloacid dehalogenase-like hydrolase [Erysipelotrichaceae bacterium]
MNVYDWDKTIYPKDSSAEFFLYNVKNDLTLLRFFPRQLLGWILWGLKIIDKTEMKKYFYSYLPGVKNIDEKLETFWDERISKVNSWYRDLQQEDDVVVSASAYFLVEPACRRLKIRHLIASEVDRYTGEVLSKNCSSQQKVERMIAAGYQIDEIENFYSDSNNDRFLAGRAKKAYKVINGKIKDWKF